MTVAQTGPAAPAGRVEREDPVKAEAAKAEQAKANEKAAQEAEPLEDVVSNLNELVRNLQRELRFTVDEESGETVVKVIDRETDVVVRQIPSEELLRLRKRLEEATGVIFHDSA